MFSSSNVGVKIWSKYYGLIVSYVLIALFLALRVASRKYSLDTAHLFDLFANFLETGTLYSTIAGLHRFNLHFSPILWLTAPFSLLGPSALIFLWKFLCYGAFLLIFWRMLVKEERIDWPEKQLFILLLALNPTFFLNIIDPNLWDSDLNLPFLALSLLAVTQKRFGLALAWFSVTFLVKEDMPLVGVLFGLFLTAHTGERKFLWFSLFSAACFVVITTVVMPSYAPPGKPIELMTQNYGYLGSSFSEIVLNILRDPSIILASGFWLRKTVSLMLMFGCVAFLPFARLRAMLFLLPGMAILGYAALSNEPFLDYSKHYMLVFFVFVIAAAFQSYATLPKRTARRLTMAAIALSVVVITGHIVFRSWTYYLVPIDNFAAVESALAEVPEQDPMLTNNLSSPWKGYGRKFQVTPNFDPQIIARGQYPYILINKRTAFWEVLSDDANVQLKANLRALNDDAHYEVVFNREDVVLLKKHASTLTEAPQPRWSDDLEKFENINQVSMKPDFVKQLRRM